MQSLLSGLSPCRALRNGRDIVSLLLGKYRAVKEKVRIASAPVPLELHSHVKDHASPAWIGRSSIGRKAQVAIDAFPIAEP